MTCRQTYRNVIAEMAIFVFFFFFSRYPDVALSLLWNNANECRNWGYKSETNRSNEGCLIYLSRTQYTRHNSERVLCLIFNLKTDKHEHRMHQWLLLYQSLCLDYVTYTFLSLYLSQPGIGQLVKMVSRGSELFNFDKIKFYMYPVYHGGQRWHSG